jgi:hypothetical protein
MTTLPDGCPEVQSTPVEPPADAPAFEPSDAERAFAAAAELPAPDDDLLTDLAQLRDWAGERTDPARDPLGALALVNSCLCDAVFEMEFHRQTSAREYARSQGIDLDAVKLPTVPRRSPLAEALDTEASWFLSLDSDAGRLAAFHILDASHGVDWFGAADLRDFIEAEAAFRAAAREAEAESGDQPDPLS